MRDTPSPSCRAIEKRPFELADGTDGAASAGGIAGRDGSVAFSTVVRAGGAGAVLGGPSGEGAAGPAVALAAGRAAPA